MADPPCLRLLLLAADTNSATFDLARLLPATPLTAFRQPRPSGPDEGAWTTLVTTQTARLPYGRRSISLTERMHSAEHRLDEVTGA
ncbi:hypothetical protein [Streptomyces xantholiticus]|uniref:hypothetical protein n=1 Tax=Streptomyces xantholiticus TaxID=68285 RepID=UPI0016778ADE|nr:hypothetical protein [Streptomyces xantholiticus]GGW74507.1 hypothetical protein GCM10010381_69110 [Streptomyces xantholiticus]